MTRRLLCCLLAIAPIAMSPVVARAQPADSSTSKLPEAKSYVDAGLMAQKSGDYETALLLYKKAYELVPHPVLLFNMAQAHRLAGRVEQALTLYHKYLDTAPNGPEARTARQLIAELEARKASEARSSERASQADRAEAADAARRADEPRKTERQGTGTGDTEQPEVPSQPVADTTAEPEVPEPEPRSHDAAPRTLLRVGVGASVAGRRLTFDTRSGFMEAPPQIATTAGAGRIEGEIYPFALANPDSALAGLGLALSYDKTFSVGLRPTNQTNVVPVSQSHYELGMRYRLGVGQASTVTVGLDYAGRQFIVDRSGLVAPLDVPDVDYTMIAPTIGVYVPVETTVTIFATAAGMLMLDTGPIQDNDSYGKSTVYGIAAAGGLEIALGKRINLRFDVEYSRIDFSFDGKGQQTFNRDNDPTTQDVGGATDRSIGLAMTAGLVY
jgi:tetratricopeptide (TPR) repeat protein